MYIGINCYHATVLCGCVSAFQDTSTVHVVAVLCIPVSELVSLLFLQSLYVHLIVSTLFLFACSKLLCNMYMISTSTSIFLNLHVSIALEHSNL